MARVSIIVAPKHGVCGAGFSDIKQARTLVSDRQADNVAFEGERVIRVPRRLSHSYHQQYEWTHYWFFRPISQQHPNPFRA